MIKKSWLAMSDQSDNIIAVPRKMGFNSFSLTDKHDKHGK